MYMSPEQFSGKEYNHAADIWSLGTILFELLVLQQYDVKTEMQKDPMFIQKQREKLQAVYSEPLLEIMQQCLNESPEKRPSFISGSMDSLLLEYSVHGKD